VTAVRYVIRAELTKIVSLRAVWLVTGVVVALHLLVCTANAGNTADAVSEITPDGLIELFAGERRPARPALVEFLVASSFQMGLFLPAIAAVAAGQEFRSHQLGRSLLAVPGRTRLIVAKTVAIAGFLLAVSVVVAGISGAYMYAAVKDWDPGLPVSAEAWAGQGKFVVFAVLTGLISAAVTILAQGTLAGIVVTVVLMALTLTQVAAAYAPALDALLPLSAGRNLLLDPAGSRLTAGAGHALAVLVAWPLVTMTAAGVALNRRDAA